LKDFGEYVKHQRSCNAWKTHLHHTFIMCASERRVFFQRISIFFLFLITEGNVAMASQLALGPLRKL
jgi:hypothetical protein